MTTAIIEYSRTEAALAELRERHSVVIQNDPTTTKGLTALKEFRATVRGLRTSLEAERKRIKEPALERCRLIDSEAKRITAALLEVEEPTDDIIKREEARKAAIKAEQERIERERVAAIQQNVLALTQWPQRAVGKSAAEMKDMLAELTGFMPSEEVFAEFTEQAEAVIRQSIQTLADMVERAVAQEEARRAAEEEAARMKAERDRVAAELAEQRRQQEAERQAMAAEMAKLEAARAVLAKERAQAEEAERMRLQAIEEAAQKEAEVVKPVEPPAPAAAALSQPVQPSLVETSAENAADAEMAPGGVIVIPPVALDVDAITWAINKLMEKRVHLESTEATKMIDRLAYMVTPDWPESER